VKVTLVGERSKKGRKRRAWDLKDNKKTEREGEGRKIERGPSGLTSVRLTKRKGNKGRARKGK